jgi:type IV pilus assembly protein PilN
MIKINLLIEKRKKKAPKLSISFISGAAILVITVLILGVFTFHLTSKVSNMKNEETAKVKRLSELKVLLKEVENYERDNESYKKKNMVIEQLKKNQNVPMRLLDEVSAQLPQGVWLSSLTDREGGVNITGYAFTNSDLVGYVQNLKGSKYLIDVTLLESRQTTLGNVSLYQFKLTFRVKV